MKQERNPFDAPEYPQHGAPPVLPPLDGRPLVVRRVLATFLMIVLPLALILMALFPPQIGQPSNDDTPTPVRCDRLYAGQRLFQIVPEQSLAWYQVEERLLRSTTVGTPVGRTRSMAGYIVIDPATPANSRVCQIAVNAASFTSDNDLRDRVLRANYLQADDFPSITFEMGTLDGFPQNPREGATLNFDLLGALTIRDITQATTWQIEVMLDGDRLVGEATTEITRADFGIAFTLLEDFVSVGETVALHVEFVAQATEIEAD